MTFDSSIVVMCGLVAILMVITWRKKGKEGVHAGLKNALGLAAVMVRIAPFALLAALLMAQIIPNEIIASYIGEETGLQGMLIASIAGGCLPSGPFLSFPIALTLFHTGAGQPQLVAFITGWSVYAFYRMMVWEVPMMGARFALQRLSVSLILPPLSGVFAGALFKLL